jgi:hypothetical protein
LKHLLGFAFLASLVAGIWAFSESFPLVGEVTVYLGFCPHGRVNNICFNGEEAANYTTYRPNTEQQTVVYWSKNGPPSKYEHCAVRNTKNWSCTETSGTSSNVHQLLDGEYSETVQVMGIYVGQVFYQVPKWKWYLLEWQARKS